MRAVNFDPVARPYRRLEYASFGPMLERCRNFPLAQLACSRRALVLGDGDGRFLRRLLAANPGITADVVDSSRSMLRILERRVNRDGPRARRRIRLHHADACRWQPDGIYDLVVTHFFLDCLFPEQLERILDRILPHLAPDARWVISEFAIPQRGPARFLAAALIRTLYLAFAPLTGLPVRAIPDYAASLRRRGFSLASNRSMLAGLLCSQVWSLPAS